MKEEDEAISAFYFVKQPPSARVLGMRTQKNGVSMSITSMAFLVVVLLSFLSSTFAGDLVQWTDEKGTLHFSDSMDTVPAKYRRQAKLEKFKEEKLPQRSRLDGPRAARMLAPLKAGETNQRSRVMKYPSKPMRGLHDG
jgi:uncharacterized protein DUF4124